MTTREFLQRLQEIQIPSEADPLEEQVKILRRSLGKIKAIPLPEEDSEGSSQGGSERDDIKDLMKGWMDPRSDLGKVNPGTIILMSLIKEK